jgi:hypothetical protein
MIFLCLPRGQEQLYIGNCKFNCTWGRHVFLDSYKILWYLTGSKFKQSKRGRYFLGSTNSEPNQEVLPIWKASRIHNTFRTGVKPPWKTTENILNYDQLHSVSADVESQVSQSRDDFFAIHCWSSWRRLQTPFAPWWVPTVVELSTRHPWVVAHVKGRIRA